MKWYNVFLRRAAKKLLDAFWGLCQGWKVMKSEQQRPLWSKNPCGSDSRFHGVIRLPYATGLEAIQPG